MLDLNGVAVLHAPPPAAAKPDQPDGEREEEEKSEIETQGRTAEQAAKEAEAAAAKKAAALAAASATSVIAATARVFVRRLFLENAEITFGGVGEVCTRAEFRSHGYADLCLQRCMRYMRLLHLQLSVLHTSPALVPFYASKGYRSVDRWTGVKSDLEAESEAGIVGEGRKHGAFSLRLMPYDNFFSATMVRGTGSWNCTFRPIPQT
jgi:predicted acetyltransferase